jgi:hypothetical protein
VGIHPNTIPLKIIDKRPSWPPSDRRGGIWLRDAFVFRKKLPLFLLIGNSILFLASKAIPGWRRFSKKTFYIGWFQFFRLGGTHCARGWQACVHRTAAPLLP